MASALGASPDAATPEPPPPTLAAPAANQQASWQNLWGSWPAGRFEQAAAYDTDRKLLVVYGGQAGTNGPYYNDTWEWNASRGSWTQRTNNGQDAGQRVGHTLAYDPVAKKTFMFSGWQPGASFYIPGQWEWDGNTSTWTERLIAGVQPDPRHDHTMLYNPDRQRIVVFGGRVDESATGRRNDLWEWDGVTGTWTDCTPSGMKPPARWGHTMTYDTVRKKLVVYGGNTGTTVTGNYVNETWEWTAGSGACNTGTWAPVTTTGNAPVYYGNAGYIKIGYDVLNAKTISLSTGDYDYSLDMTVPTWTKITSTYPTNDYPTYGYATVNYDPDRSNLIVYSGAAYTRKLWDFTSADGTWLDRSNPTNGPIQRSYPALGYDTKRGKLMLFGGHSTIDNLDKQDIWEWSGNDQNWVSRTSVATKPDARQQTAIAYDSTRDLFLLYGGYGTTTYNDVWTWDPNTRVWAPVTINGAGPVARYGHTMYYDAKRDRFLVYGGSQGQQIWEYSPGPATWTDRTPPAAAIPVDVGRTSGAVTFDSDRERIMITGGYFYSSTVGYVYNTDIWEWDASASGTSQWSSRTPVAGSAGPPVGRTNLAIAYDSGRRVMVLIAGHANATGNTSQLNDSWEWDPAARTWTETTPPVAVKPLPRESHLLVYDAASGNTLLFGGNVTADTTYGASEIWEYLPNSAPRPNGAACSTATAARCATGNCVDGVCCAAAACPGTCRACNVPGSAGTCADVLAGTPDDSCTTGQACDATHVCKSQNGQTCGSIGDCASGHCIDGVCCDTDCTDTCKACNLTTKRGTCSNLSAGQEDPLAAPTCVSDVNQGRFCDGNGVCTNAPKPNGASCTAGGQCASTYCIDGVCCNSACGTLCYSCTAGATPGVCTFLAAGLQDHSATGANGVMTSCDQPTQYCVSGTCQTNKKPNGQACSAAGDCGSNYCVDGYCCNSACTGTCQSCKVSGKLGSCVNVPAGTPDDNAAVKCSLPTYCDAAGTCQSSAKANGLSCTQATECASGFCVDGYCCDGACSGDCSACNIPQLEGTCSLLTPGTSDPPTCAAPSFCGGGGICATGKKPTGTTCALNNECGSNYCIDGVCCDSACFGKCMSCKNTTGTCMPVAANQDPRKDCMGAGVCAGTCDGQGGCLYPAAGVTCGTNGCASDGVIHKPGMCDGAGHCAGDVFDDCKGFTCVTDSNNKATCLTSCATDPNCQNAYYCNNAAKCPPSLELGHVCDRDRQCISGHCAFAKPGDATGLCCDRDCHTCGSCNLPGKEGICQPVAAGTDSLDCVDSASDPTGKCGGKCNGQWGCQFPAAGTSCGQCKACDGASKCTVIPDDDATCGSVDGGAGVIDCDGLDNMCNDYHDITVRRCAAFGRCKAPNDPATCTDVTSLCQTDAGSKDATGSTDATGSKDATGGTDATTGKDAAGATDATAGTDATSGTDAPAPKGGGGGCCSVGAAGSTGMLPTLAFGLMLVMAGRRRRRR